MIDINQVQRDFDNGVMLCRETIRQVIELAAVKNADARKLARAERALLSAGFQDLGGEEWKPPLGKRPDFAKGNHVGSGLALAEAIADETIAGINKAPYHYR